MFCIQSFYRFVRLFRRHTLFNMIEDNQRGAGIFPRHINLFIDHRITGNHRGNVGLWLHLKPFLLQILHRQGRENMLLSEAFGRQNQWGGVHACRKKQRGTQ